MKHTTIIIFLIFLISGCNYAWQCECYAPAPDSINENNLLMLGYLNPRTKNKDDEGKPYYTKPYSFTFVIRSRDQLAEDASIEQITVMGSNSPHITLLKEPAEMKVTKLNPQAFSGMKSELSYEAENINIDIYNQPIVQVSVLLFFNGAKKEITFKFKGNLKKLSAPIV